MTEPVSSRGFRGRRQPGATAARLTPGQYETRDFPGNRGPPPGRNAAVRRTLRLSPARGDDPNGCGASVRLLGARSKVVRAALRTAWSAARLALIGKPAPDLRKG